MREFWEAFKSLFSDETHLQAVSAVWHFFFDDPS